MSGLIEALCSGFVPKLVATLVAVPRTQPSITYVIANSLVTSEKQKTAKYHYNLRVVETRVASRLLHDHLKLNVPMDLPTMKHSMDAQFASDAMHTSSEFLIERKRRLTIMIQIVEELFGDCKEGNSWEDVYKRLGGIDADTFKERFHPDFEIEADSLKLYNRAKHQVSKVHERQSLALFA